MENKTGLLVTLIVVAALVNLAGLIILGANQVDEQALKESITAQLNADLDEKLAALPAPATAAEIAALIVVPEAPGVPEFDVPEFKSDSYVKDLWEDMYSYEIEELETGAYDVAVEELEDHDYKDLANWLESLIEGFDELEDVDVEDYEINIIDLGLDEDEDKAAEVVFELEVEYTLKEGVVEDYKKKVIATASVVFDEGVFNDEDVELVFA